MMPGKNSQRAIALAFIVLSALVHTDVSACGGLLKRFDPELSPYMKQIAANGIVIPVTSTTFGREATFNEIGIARHFKGEDIVWPSTNAGQRLEALNGAQGYALVRFRLNVNVRAIPAIANDIATIYPTIANDLKLHDVKGQLQFLDAFGRIVARQDFDLAEGQNDIRYCDFARISEPVSQARIELKSYSVSYNGTRQWPWP